MTDHTNRQPPKPDNGSRPDAELTPFVRQASARGFPMAGTIQSGETAADRDSASVWEIDQGTDVLCRDGEKIGEVVDVMPGYLVVEQGFFDPHDIYVPVDMIGENEKHGLVLLVDRDEFEERDWTEEPDQDPDPSP
jgi:hypothetical protein